MKERLIEEIKEIDDARLLKLLFYLITSYKEIKKAKDN